MPPADAKSDIVTVSTSKLKTVSTLVDLAKNVMLICIFGYLFFYSRSAIKTMFHHVADGDQNVSHLKIGGGGVDITLTDKLAEAQKSLNVALDDTAKTNGKTDHPASSTGQNIIAAQSAITSALQTVASNNAATTGTSVPVATVQQTAQAPVRWVYLGQRQGGKWNFNYFNLKGEPAIGATVRATADVYKRDQKPFPNPTPTDPTNWDIGDPVGVVHQNTSVTIKDLLPLGSKDDEIDWWAQIS